MRVIYLIININSIHNTVPCFIIFHLNISFIRIKMVIYFIDQNVNVYYRANSIRFQMKLYS